MIWQPLVGALGALGRAAEEEARWATQAAAIHASVSGLMASGTPAPQEEV